MSRHAPSTYKTTNWPAYNEALKRRASLTIWLDPEVSWEAAPTGRRGRQASYSDAAIQTCENAKPWKLVIVSAVARNEALRTSKYLGRAIWRTWSGCHRRSRVETKMHCVKLPGQRLMARGFDRLEEFYIGCCADADDDRGVPRPVRNAEFG